MKRTTVILAILVLSSVGALFVHGICVKAGEQQPTINLGGDMDLPPSRVWLDQQPTTQPKANAVKMPSEYSAKLAELQQQSEKLEKDYSQVIPLYKDYVAKRDAIQAQAAVLITRAALAAHLTIEQLDNSTLTIDEKGNYQWVPKQKTDTTKTAPK